MNLVEAIAARHSVRHYINKEIEVEKIEHLQLLVAECNAQSGLHIQLITGEPRSFGESLLARYGKFSGVTCYFAMIGKTVQRFYQGRAEHKNGGYEMDATDAFNASGWKHVDVVATDDKTKVYINGEEVSSADNTVKLTTALGESPVLQFGKANWGSGEF